MSIHSTSNCQLSHKFSLCDRDKHLYHFSQSYKTIKGQRYHRFWCVETPRTRQDWKTFQEGKRIEFRGFGSFAAKEYEGYIGRNPDTGEETVVPAKRRLRFRMSDVLFTELNKDLDG